MSAFQGANLPGAYPPCGRWPVCKVQAAGPGIAQRQVIDFSALPLSVNLAIFGAAAAVVWLAGTRLAAYADAIGSRTSLNQALLGMALLGVATSLPEIATTITGGVIRNPDLVIGNLFGGVALQTAVLPLVDFAIRGALTYASPKPVLLFQGVMLMLMLALALAGAVLGEPLSAMGIGVTPLLLGVTYLVTLRVTGTGKYLPRWRPLGVQREEGGRESVADGNPLERSTRVLFALCGVAAVTILLAGWTLTLTGDALAEQTGLGSTFVGVVLIAASTSLPELSTTLAAVRHGNYEMAVSNILGTNCLTIAMFLIGDVAYRDGPILAETHASGLLAGAMGLIVTALLLLGLLERRDETLGRLGYDSVAILIAYGVGLAGLYYLR